MTPDSIIEKIRKLLALAESPNEHEAALAAQRAQELMLKHHVEEARVRGGAPETAKVGQEKAVIYSEYPAPASRIPYWQLFMMGGIARAFCCDHYYVPGRAIYLVGRESDRQVAKYMFEYLRREVERLAESGWRTVGQAAGVHGGVWKRGFCIGAAQEIRARLYEKTTPPRTAGKLPAAPVTETAMVLRNRLEDVSVWMKENLQLKTGHSNRTAPSSGYAEGRAAGKSVSLGNDGKGVGSGARRLPQAVAP